MNIPAGQNAVIESGDTADIKGPREWLERTNFALLVAAFSAAAWGQIKLSAHNDIGWVGYAVALVASATAARLVKSPMRVFSYPPIDNRFRRRWWLVLLAVAFSVFAHNTQLNPVPDEQRVLIWWLLSIGVLLMTFLFPIRHQCRGDKENGDPPKRCWPFRWRVRSSVPSIKQWLDISAIILLCGAALVIRLPHLERFPAAVHDDEGSCGLMAQQVLERRAAGETYWFRFCDGYRAFPAIGFFPSAALQSITGNPLFGHRLANVVLSMVSLVCLFFLVQSLFGRATAFVAVSLAVSAHVAVHWSRSGIHSGHAAWLTVICILLAWLATSKGRLQWFVVLGFSLACCFLTYSAAYLIPVYLFVTVASFWVTSGRFRRSFTIPALLCCISVLVFLSPWIAEIRKYPVDHLQSKSASMIWSTKPHVIDHMKQFSAANPRWGMVEENIRNSKYLLQNSGDKGGQYGNRGIGIVDQITAVALIVGLGVLLGNASRFNHWPILLLIVLNFLGGVVFAMAGVQYSRIAGLALIIMIVPATGMISFVESGRRLFGRAGSLAGGVAVIVAVAWIGYTNLHYYFVQHDRTYGEHPNSTRNAVAGFVRDLGSNNLTLIHDSLPNDLSHPTFRLICDGSAMFSFQALEDLDFSGIDDFETVTILTPPGKSSQRVSPQTKRIETFEVGLISEIASKYPGGVLLDTRIPYHPDLKVFDAYQLSIKRGQP